MEKPEECNRVENPSCVDCAAPGCRKATGVYPPYCETGNVDDERRRSMIEAYSGFEEEAMKAASATSRRAKAEYLCRVEEIMDYARRMGYRKIGIAMCSGLQSEGRTFAKILRLHGFEAYGVACKVGALKEYEITHQDESSENGAVSCNPLEQARLLNEQHTDLNVVIGLCVGHDSLFYKNSEAPVTTLVTKDRALGNNPAVALYVCSSHSSNYSRLMKENDSLSSQA